jgi:hypothetical protein
VPSVVIAVSSTTSSSCNVQSVETTVPYTGSVATYLILFNSEYQFVVLVTPSCLKVDLKPKHNPFKTRIDTPKVSGSSG